MTTLLFVEEGAVIPKRHPEPNTQRARRHLQATPFLFWPAGHQGVRADARLGDTQGRRPGGDWRARNQPQYVQIPFLLSAIQSCFMLCARLVQELTGIPPRSFLCVETNTDDSSVCDSVRVLMLRSVFGG